MDDDVMRVSPRRARGDDGAVLVEAVLILPVLLALLLGTMDVGYWYRGNLTVSDGASDGAKWGAIQGNKLTAGGETADYTSMAIMRQAMANLDPSTIERIVIFKAQAPSFGSPAQQVPAACKTASSSVAGRCNIYFPIEAFREVQDGNANFFRCVSPSDPACGWNPVLRADGPASVDIDYLGVYIKLKHRNLTGFLGPSRDIETAKISRLEPGNLVQS